MTIRSQIIIRQSESWNNINEKSHIDSYRKKFGHMLEWDQYKERFEIYIKNVKYWNSELPISYYQYRFGIYQIAQKTWEQTGIEIVHYKDFKFEPDPDLILVPTDDDDWFRPDLHNHLTILFDDTKVDIVVWRCHHLNANGMHCESINDRVGGNGYAIRASVATERLLLHHAAVNDVQFNRTMQIGNSIWVRHAACWTNMSKSDFEFIPIENIAINESLSWAKQHVQELQCLNM